MFLVGFFEPLESLVFLAEPCINRCKLIKIDISMRGQVIDSGCAPSTSCEGRQASSFQSLPCIRCWALSNLLLGQAALGLCDEAVTVRPSNNRCAQRARGISLLYRNPQFSGGPGLARRE